MVGPEGEEANRALYASQNAADVGGESARARLLAHVDKAARGPDPHLMKRIEKALRAEINAIRNTTSSSNALRISNKSDARASYNLDDMLVLARSHKLVESILTQQMPLTMLILRQFACGSRFGVSRAKVSLDTQCLFLVVCAASLPVSLLPTDSLTGSIADCHFTRVQRHLDVAVAVLVFVENTGCVVCSAAVSWRCSCVSRHHVANVAWRE